MENNYKFNPEMYKVVANNVNKYMNKKHITIGELSYYAAIDEVYLDKFLNSLDNVTISIYDLYKISVILEVSINKFFLE